MFRQASSQHAGELLRLLHRRLDVVEAHEVGGLLGVVDDVVQRRRERVDVLAVDRGHRRAVQPVDDVVRDPVALLLADQDLAAEPAGVGPLLQQPAQQLGGMQDVRARLVEEVEELAVLWERGSVGPWAVRAEGVTLRRQGKLAEVSGGSGAVVRRRFAGLLGVEPVADAEVGVQVDASRARRPRASCAACGRTRPPSGRRAPSRIPTRARRCARAGSRGRSTPDRSWSSSNSRRVRPTRAPADERLEHVRPDLELAGDHRLGGSVTDAPGLPRAQRRLDARQHLLGMARLRDPVVGAEPQAPHPLGDRGRPGADDHHLARRAGAELPEIGPGLACRASRRRSRSRAGACARTLLRRRRAAEHLRAPADGADALGEDAHEAAVGVDDRQPRRPRGRLRESLRAWLIGCGPSCRFHCAPV